MLAGGNDMAGPEQAAAEFIRPADSIASVEEYGRGIIHDTYLVTLAGSPERFILQRLNTHVFTRPELIMHNLRLLCDHVDGLKKRIETTVDRDWKTVRIIPTGDNRDLFVDPGGNYWRALTFIPNAHPLEKVAGPGDAREAGRGLGIFHSLTNSLASEDFADTLPGFHNVEMYLNHYDRVAAGSGKLSGSAVFCVRFIEDRRGWAPVLENGRQQKKLQLRIIHGDPKISNILLDDATGRAVSIIDLDTVKPGLLQYDIGDLLRSCCTMPGEDAPDPDTVRFDLQCCEAALSGYMSEARTCVTAGDLDFLFDGIRLIPFELGLRFFTDFLAGNVYFKADRPAQNLERAMVQFRLVESIEQQEDNIRRIIEKLRIDN